MQIYLVRHIETKEIAGLFCGSKVEVWDTVDEIDDPYSYEYAVLNSGAIYTHAIIGEGPIAQQWDFKKDDDEESIPFDWSSFNESEVFCEQLHCQNQLRWHRFDASDVGIGLIARIVQNVD